MKKPIYIKFHVSNWKIFDKERYKYFQNLLSLGFDYVPSYWSTRNATKDQIEFLNNL